MIDSIRESEPKYLDSGGEYRELLYKLADGREVGFGDLPVGAMFYNCQVPEDQRIGPDSLCVVLPGKVIWKMHHPATRDGKYWTITGGPPNVSAVPSIDFGGVYHGFVTNGWVTEDYNGRKFTEAGEPIK